MKKILFLLVSVIILASSCRKDEPPEPKITPAEARDSLYYLMNIWYYWNRSMPVVNPADYDDPYELMDAMRYRELDRWSFVIDYDDNEALMKGTFVGHGYMLGIDGDQNARIAMIYPNSPLFKKGVRRGWVVRQINGSNIAEAVISGDEEEYNRIMGPSEAGIVNNFLFEPPDAPATTISDTKSTFTVNSVILYDTLNLKSGKTGHLVFDSFIEPSENELAVAFGFFRSQNVTDLILDLRYNSGGLLNIAQLLASYIAGNDQFAAQDVFTNLIYNEDMKGYNDYYSFLPTAYPLNLNRIVVITSDMTASASEVVINGLRPFTQVITIGETTEGKPVGMMGWDIDRAYVFWPVTFELKNSLNEGGYFDGIAPDARVADDITRDFDNRDELCLKEAIHYLENGTFSGSKSIQTGPLIYRSEKPGILGNTLIGPGDNPLQ